MQQPGNRKLSATSLYMACHSTDDPQCVCCNRQGQCGSIPLCILPSAPAADWQSPEQRQQEGTGQDSPHIDRDCDTRSLEDRGFKINEDLGFLAAPVDASPQEIYSHVEVRLVQGSPLMASLQGVTAPEISCRVV